MGTRKLLKRGIPLYIMILPGFLFFAIFKYAPMFGLLVAFQDYDPFSGFWHSDWVGLEQFVRLFTHNNFWVLMKNTFTLAFLDIVFHFPAPIILAILLNEIRRKYFKKVIQTITYAPHFVSWVVIVGITITLFSTQNGSINIMLQNMGMDPIPLLTEPQYFRWVWVFQNIWHETGWGAIILLAALSSIDPQLYESAKVDGASRMRQIWHITLPGLLSVAIILFILRLGNFMDIGFEHVFLLQNPLNLDVSDVFDTYVYRTALFNGEFSYATAVGLFKSVVGVVLVIGANKAAEKFGQEGVF